MNFDSFGLSPALLGALKSQGYESATPIQAKAIPPALQGRDLLASAPTGTGKTAAFSLPLLQRLFAESPRSEKRSGKRHPRALVLTPTRELAAQVHDSLRACGKQLPLRSHAIFGGVGMHGQLQALRRGLDVIVATPGRLIDHAQRGSLDLGAIEVLVLGEADRMLDMGFLPALRNIIGRLPGQRQTLLFSATFPEQVKSLAGQFMNDPVQIQAAPPNRVAALVRHVIHPVDIEQKRELLLHVLAEDSRRQALVFSRTKRGADRLVRFLEKYGLKAAAIHGNKSQNQRTRVLRDFKNGRVTVLVATDIAARGLDIEQLPLVINHDLPMVAEDYVHRIGRTGRAGASGLAVSLVSYHEAGLLADIQKLLEEPLEVVPVSGFEPSKPLPAGKAAGQPNRKPRRRRSRRRGQSRSARRKTAASQRRPASGSGATGSRASRF